LVPPVRCTINRTDILGLGDKCARPTLPPADVVVIAVVGGPR
jgi:hypothetical protein